MFNRRFIRIKVFQSLYAFLIGTYSDLYEAEKELKKTFDRVYELYHYLLLLIIELADYFNKKYENYQNHFIKNPEDIENKYLKFANNLLIKQLRENPYLQNYLKNHKHSWSHKTEFLNSLLKRIVSLREFKEYTKNLNNNYEEDKEFLLFIIEVVMYMNDNFIFTIEEESFYYTDNTEFALFSAALTIEQFKENQTTTNKLLPKFKNSSDEQFAITLLNRTILSIDKNTEIIKQNLQKFDYETMPLIEKIIVMLAISEIVEFSEIPVKVSMNEYIDLAKYYGIPNRSFAVVNGLLDKIVKYMKDNQMFEKTGRGLFDK